MGDNTAVVRFKNARFEGNAEFRKVPIRTEELPEFSGGTLATGRINCRGNLGRQPLSFPRPERMPTKRELLKKHENITCLGRRSLAR